MLARRLVLFQFLRPLFLVAAVLCSVSRALVAVPEGRAARTVFLTSSSSTANGGNRLFLENSPLIGGPSWLPIHIKVILEDANRKVVHRWDFIPLDATNFATLRQLLLLQAVPAEIRHQRAPMSTAVENKQANPVTVVPTGFDIVITDAAATNKVGTGIDDVSSRAKQDEETDRLVQRANAFCESYPEKLHLIHNNCWRFASELYDHLSSSSSATANHEADDDAAGNDKAADEAVPSSQRPVSSTVSSEMTSDTASQT